MTNQQQPERRDAVIYAIRRKHIPAADWQAFADAAAENSQTIGAALKTATDLYTAARRSSRPPRLTTIEALSLADRIDAEPKTVGQTDAARVIRDLVAQLAAQADERTINYENRITTSVDAERRRWYAALEAAGLEDLEGLAPEVVAARLIAPRTQKTTPRE